MLVLPETGYETAMNVAERLREAIEIAEIPGDSHPVKVTVSIGVAESTRDDTTPEDIIHRADRALYHAKQNGRNQVVGR